MHHPGLTETFVKVLLGLASGGSLLGTSCGSDIRDSLTAAGMDFIEDSAESVLDALFPIDEILAGAKPAS